MKQMLFIALMAIIIALCACNNDNILESDPDHNYKLDPTSVISVAVRQAQIPRTRGYDKKDPEFITLYAWEYACKSWRADDGTRAVADFVDSIYYQNRDTVNWKIKFMGFDVIESDGSLGAFPQYTNIVLCVALDTNCNPVKPLNYRGTLDLKRDTVAYIPNAVMRRNLEQLTKYYEAGEFENCYKMFDTAYFFTPISGADYRKLVADGIEVRDTNFIK